MGWPRKALRGGISKVNFHQVCQLLTAISHKNEETAPRTRTGYPHEGPFVEESQDQILVLASSHTEGYGGIFIVFQGIIKGKGLQALVQILYHILDKTRNVVL